MLNGCRDELHLLKEERSTGDSELKRVSNKQKMTVSAKKRKKSEDGVLSTPTASGAQAQAAQ